MRYLITASLYNSYKYFLSCSDENYEQKKEEFIKTLRREKSEPTAIMQRGIDFENQIQAYTKGGKAANEVVREIGDIVKGGLWQQKVSGEISVGKWELFLYGIMDTCKQDTIFDIKRLFL